MRIAILSRQPLLYSTNALMEAGRARGHDMQVMDTLRFDIGIRHRQPELFYNGQPVSGIDAVIPRIGASITFYGLAVVRQFEMMGVYCLNDSQAIARSRDKLRSLQLLARHNLGIPPTMFTRQAEHVPACIQRVEGPPVIVKLLEGTQGVGVVLAESERAASSVVEAFHGLDQNILIQQFIREAKGADTRVLVVGGKVVAAMKRQAKPGEFRSNLHRGGSSKKVRLSAEYRRCALTATKVLGLQLAGVDLIESGNGPMIMEVNSSPGLEGITKTSGIDVADAIIRYLESEVPPPEPPASEPTRP